MQPNIQDFPLFQHICKDSIAKLENAMRFHHYKEEDILYDYNEDAISCYFVFEGAVKQQNYTMDGRYIHLSYHRVGEYFGYSPAFEPSQRVCRALCSEDSVVGELSNQDFIDIFLEDKFLALDLIKKLVAFSNEQILMRSGKSILCSEDLVVLDLLRRRKKLASDFVDMPPRAEWAAYLGITPETLSRVITKIKKTGAIKLHGDDIEVLDDSSLKTSLSD